MRSAPAYQWLAGFVKSPDYSANWGVERSAAFLNILEAASHTLKKRDPDLKAAAVLRHRHKLLRNKSNLKLFSALALMSPKEVATLASEHESTSLLVSLPIAQITALDPSKDDLETQCAPQAESVKKLNSTTTPKPRPAPATRSAPGW